LCKRVFGYNRSLLDNMSSCLLYAGQIVGTTYQKPSHPYPVSMRIR